MFGDNRISHIYFEFGHMQVFACCDDKVIGEMSYATKEDFHQC